MPTERLPGVRVVPLLRCTCVVDLLLTGPSPELRVELADPACAHPAHRALHASSAAPTG